MTKEQHTFTEQKLRKMNQLEICLHDFASNFSSFMNDVTQIENDYKSRSSELKKLEVQLEGVEKMIRERRVMAEAGTAQMRDVLQKRHLELVEREAKIDLKERQIAEQQKRINELLGATEVQVASKKKGRVEAGV